jgi:hypothetical protein
MPDLGGKEKPLSIMIDGAYYQHRSSLEGAILANPVLSWLTLLVITKLQL